MRQNKCEYDIPRWTNIGGEIRDMVLVERALNEAQIDIVERARSIQHANQRALKRDDNVRSHYFT